MHQGLRLLLVVTLLATFIVVTPSAVSAATFVVTNSNDSGPGSLRQAIIDANDSSDPGRDINIDESVTDPIELESPLPAIVGAVTIDAPDANSVTVTRATNAGEFRIFEIAPSEEVVVIYGLIITNGVTDGNGGGILAYGDLNLSGSTVTGNQAANGGGVYADRYLNLLEDVTISNNTATTDGGGIYATSNAVMTVFSGAFGESIITGNTATSGNGGGIHNGGTLTISSSETSVTGNTAASGNGGGIYNTGGTVTIQAGATVSDNDAQFDGGGIHNAGSLTITDSNILDNTAVRDGGGIASTAGTLAVTRSLIDGNEKGSRDEASALFLTGGTATIVDSTISNNDPGPFDVVEGSGAIYTSGSNTELFITTSTLTNNASNSTGGALYVTGDSTATISQSTFVGNSADSGGAISVEGGSTAIVQFSTISGNQASSFGAGINNNGSVTLTGTIVEGNPVSELGAPSDVRGAVTSDSSYNFIGNDGLLSGITSGTNGNMIGTITNPIDAMLEPLADNGGPTETMLPQENSPVIDAGGNTCPDADQRGFDRPDGSACDIGAVEVQFPDLTVPDDFQVVATGSDGATVDFAGDVSATDWEGNSTAVTCVPASGSTFEVGTTTVECSTTGEVDYDVTETFDITVTSPDGPTLDLPDDITETATSPAGATVTFNATATDGLGNTIDVDCDPPSGSTFAPGVTVVECSATDGFDQTVEDTFTVTINPPAPPTIAVPDNMTVDSTSPAGATVEFEASATDAFSTSLEVSCTPASGTVFAPGTTVVTCSATDDFDQTVDDTFTVTVVELDADQQLHLLIQEVRDARISFLVKPRLLALLAVADLSLHRGQTSATCAGLTAFTVSANLYGTVRLIPASLAADWTADALRIGQALGCGGTAFASPAEPAPAEEQPEANPPETGRFNIFSFIFGAGSNATRPWR